LPLRTQRGVDGRSIVSGKETSLQFSDPIPALKFRQSRVTCQTALESKLIESLIIERAEFRGQPTKGSDKSELHREVVNDETEPNLLGKREGILGFALYLSELISRRKKVFDQMIAAVRRKGNVSDLVRGIEGATHQIAAGLDMFRPWHDDISEGHIGSSLKTLQSAFFDQVIAKPTEAKSVLVVTETRPGYDGEPYISEAGRVAVTVLEAEIHQAANNERRQVLVAKQCRRHNLGQDVHSVEEVPVGHQGQVDEFFDLSRSHHGPDSIVLAPYLVTGRMWRPISASESKVIQAYLHSAVAPIQSGVKREAQTCDNSDIVPAFGVLC